MPTPSCSELSLESAMASMGVLPGSSTCQRKMHASTRTQLRCEASDTPGSWGL